MFFLTVHDTERKQNVSLFCSKLRTVETKYLSSFHSKFSIGSGFSWIIMPHIPVHCFYGHILWKSNLCIYGVVKGINLYNAELITGT
jgi:hypothetical protein